MKKCDQCNIEMIDNTSLHTDYVGGISFEEQIYLSYVDGKTKSKNIFGKEQEVDNEFTERVMARVCPKCGKVELYIDVNNTID